MKITKISREIMIGYKKNQIRVKNDFEPFLYGIAIMLREYQIFV